MRKAMHNLTLYSVASSALIYSHSPVPTHLPVAISLKIYLALFLVHTQLSTQFLRLWKLFSMPSSQIIAIFSIFSLPLPGSDSCNRHPSFKLLSSLAYFKLQSYYQVSATQQAKCYVSTINLFSLQEGNPDSSVWPLMHCLTAFAPVSARSLWEWLLFYVLPTVASFWISRTLWTPSDLRDTSHLPQRFFPHVFSWLLYSVRSWH